MVFDDFRANIVDDVFVVDLLEHVDLILQRIDCFLVDFIHGLLDGKPFDRKYLPVVSISRLDNFSVGAKA